MDDRQDLAGDIHVGQLGRLGHLPDTPADYIPDGDDPDDLVVGDHRQVADLGLGHLVGRVLDRGVGRDGVQVAKQLQLPVYDVQIVGYPERMRAYNARLKASRSERILGDEAPPVRTSRPPGRTPRPPRESQS